MELSLTVKEAQLLHSVVEHYLDGVRDAYGHNPPVRPLLEEEQKLLEDILHQLHAAAR